MRFAKGLAAAVAVVAALGMAAVAYAGDGDGKKGERHEKGAKGERAFLGIAFEAQDAAGAKGIVVGKVLAGTAAEKAGIQKGDAIVKLAGKAVATPKELMELLGRAKPGDEVEVTLVRDGWEKSVKVKLGKAPKEDDDGDDDDDDDD